MTKSRTAENYALLSYNGSKIGKLTVCAWVDLAYDVNDYQDFVPAVISYSSPSGSTNEFFLMFEGVVRFGLKGTHYR